MASLEVLRLEAAHYRLLQEQLKEEYSNLDDETLRDTMEGISELPTMVEHLVRSSLEDDILIVGLKSRLDAMTERLARIKERHTKKRSLAAWAMGSAGIPKIEASDFSVSLSAGAQRLEIVDGSQIPEAFLIPLPPKIDRTAITAALKRGEIVTGAAFETGNSFIAVRTK
jgi:hypothetical protein